MRKTKKPVQIWQQQLNSKRLLQTIKLRLHQQLLPQSNI
jgi:hypothetical protein